MAPTTFPLIWCALNPLSAASGCARSRCVALTFSENRWWCVCVCVVLTLSAAAWRQMLVVCAALMWSVDVECGCRFRWRGVASDGGVCGADVESAGMWCQMSRLLMDIQNDSSRIIDSLVSEYQVCFVCTC
eukprot:3556033-Rhodomonas_salina.1